ncbi:MAG: hypothetical protein GX316_08920 [Firmicutes bacterium]|nr:hypothetical protein [Bacillota bacterium]
MATYNTVIKKRNALNNGWDSILPITTADNVLLNEQGDTVATELPKKVDKIEGKGLSTEDYTSAEKSKLAGVEAGANNYAHPASHPASMITQDSVRQFVSDTDKANWNGKQDKVPAGESGNLLTYSGVLGQFGTPVKPSVVGLSVLTADSAEMARMAIGAATDDSGGGTWDDWVQMPGYYVSTVFNSNGSITETLKNSGTQAVFATKTTVFNSATQITETVAKAGGGTIKTVTVFNADGSITQTITSA